MQNIRKKHLPFLALVSVLCFWLAWPPYQGTPLLLVAFVPLLLIARHVTTHTYKRPLFTFLKYIYCAFFLWNFVTIWWINNSTPEGGIFTLLFNAYCFSISFLLFFWTKKNLGLYWGYLGFIVYWISMEYLHLFGSLSFPYLNLGNGLAAMPKWIQWYEYTGTFGGTFWLLAANIGIYHCFFEPIPTNRKWAYLFATTIWIIAPILTSYYIYFHYEERGEIVETVVVQPSINPHTCRFYENKQVATPTRRLENCIHLSSQALTKRTQLLVWPESAINYNFEEAALATNPLVKYMAQFRATYPQLTLLTGIPTIKKYGTQCPTTTAIRGSSGCYRDWFNSALCLHHHGQFSLYHKIKY